MRGRQLGPGEMGAPSVHQVRDGYRATIFVCPHEDAGTVKLARSADTKGRARARVITAAQKLIDDHKRRVLFAGPPQSLKHLVNTRLKRLETTNAVKPQSLLGYRGAVRRIVETYGDVDMRACTPGQLSGMLIEQYGNAPTLHRHCLIVLNAALGDAVADGLLIHNVAAALKGPKKKKADPKALDWDRQRQLLQFLRDPVFDGATGQQIGSIANTWSDLALLQIKVGARIGELVALRWNEDITFEDERTVVIGFTGTVISRGAAFRQDGGKTDAASRHVRVKETDVVKMLQRRRREAGPEQLRVFAGAKGGWLSPHTVNAQWRQRLDGTPLKGWATHALRRTYVTDTADGGRQLDAIAATVGHSDVGTTRRVYREVRPVIHDA